MHTSRLPVRVDSSRFPANSNRASRLSHAGFHALIGRIFSAALQRDFDAGGIVGLGPPKPRPEPDAFVAIFHPSNRKRKSDHWFSSERDREHVWGQEGKREMCGKRAPEGRDSSGSEKCSSIHDMMTPRQISTARNATYR